MHFSRFYVTFHKLLHLGIKNKQVFFVLLSILRNFATMNKWRMPAEWEPQAFVQLTWPHADTDWQPILNEITETYVEMANAISAREDLLIVHPKPEEVKELLASRISDAQMKRITFFACETNDTWARDHGFITLLEERGERREEREYHLLDFCFNGWGEKFEAKLDNAINAKLFSKLPCYGKNQNYEDHLDFVLEGGSIESDGKGTIFTTRCCLLAPHRNQPLTEKETEAELKRRLHAERVVWLDCEPMDGDDTDGHIDTMVRIAPNDTLLYNGSLLPSTPLEEERNGAVRKFLYEQLQDLRTLDGKPYRLLELPLPSPIYDEDGEQLPATYANFLILNGAVLVPTYEQPDVDNKAISIIQQAFPEREMIAIDSRSIIKQHGSIHCCTMQFPKNDK